MSAHHKEGTGRTAHGRRGRLPPVTVLILLLWAGVAAGEESPLRRVLLLNSYQPNMTWVEQIEKAVFDVLRPAENDIILYIEYMDTKHVSTPAYFDRLKEVYRIKYGHLKLDLILSSDNHAFDFLRRERDALFPGAPVVFCGVNFFKDDQISGIADFTGVAETFDARGTAELILRLHPDVETIFIINDYLKTGRAWSDTMKEDLAPLAARVAMDYAPDIPFEQLIHRIGTLRPGTVILLGVYFGDTFGRYFTYERIGALLSEAAEVPVYCLLDFNIGYGTVGGKVINGYDQGAAAAAIGLRVLDGQDAGGIPVRKNGFHRFMFDYRQLRRHRIDMGELPPESTILHRPTSFYDRHRPVILTTLGVIAFQALIIVALLMNVRRRRRAEASLKLLNETLENRVRDRTAEITKINQDLQESEAKYRNLIERAGPGFLIIQEARIKYVNHRLAAMVGWDREALIDRPFHLLASERDQDLVKDRYRRRMRGEEVPETYETVLQGRRGNSIHVEVNASVLHYMGQRADYVYVHDITGRKEVERTLKAAAEAAEAGSRAKSAFLANMSHEIRTPMNAILGFSDLLMKRAESTEQKRYLSQIHAGGRALLSLVNDVLDLSKIEAGKMEICPEPIQPRKIFADVGQVFSQKAREKGLDLRTSVDDAIPRLLMLDEPRLRQVLLNLVGNAVKFTPEGHVAVSVRAAGGWKERRRRTGERITLEIEVADTGIGIPKEQRGSVFDSFHQESGRISKKYGGTGLGLAISKRLVALMDGELSVHGRPGGGSRFRLVLPDVVVAEPAAPEAPLLPDAAGGTRFAPARILVVDDTPSNREIILGYLEGEPLEILEAESGGAALDVLAAGPVPDLILMDLRMPDKSGFETAAEIRERPEWRRIPLVAMTAYTLKEALEKTRDLFDGCLTKPMCEMDLVRELGRFLRIEQVSGPGVPEDRDTERSPGPSACASALGSDPAGIPAVFENDLLPAWRRLNGAFFMDDIAGFARRLSAMGDRYRIGALAEYGRELNEMAQWSDIGRIEALMAEFPDLVERIRRANGYPRPPTEKEPR